MTALPANLFSATWFDGRTAAAHPAHVVLVGRHVSIRRDDGSLARGVHVDALHLSEPTRRGPRFVYLDDGATLEVHDSDGFNAALEALGKGPRGVARLQRSAFAATLALALLVGGLVFGYLAGLPAAARWVAFALPDSVEQRLGAQFGNTLDVQMLRPSKLSRSRQEQLTAMLRAAAARGAPGVRWQLHTRNVRGGKGINAFTLPGGTIILLDGLVEAAGDDDQILAVLGHELGHAANKHGLRNVLQALSIGVVAGAVWGDFAGVASNAPVVLGALSYSRAFELEADEYAVQFLRANGKGAQPLIDFFEMLEEQDGDGHEVPSFLSTHPDIRERVERLKGML
jgi:Zn-dependent protease with chaperone function